MHQISKRSARRGFCRRTKDYRNFLEVEERRNGGAWRNVGKKEAPMNDR